MKIILRYVFRSMLERRLRTVLILSAIMISSAMFFASISISGTLVKMQMDAFRQNVGYTDIIIRSTTDSPSNWLTINKAEKYSKDAEYIIGEMSGFAAYINVNRDVQNSRSGSAADDRNRGFNGKAGTVLRGIDMDDLKMLTPFILESEKNLYPFKGMKAVISSDTAKKYGLQCGNKMLLEINGSKYRFILCGIIKATGAFAESGGSFPTIMPLRTVNSLYNAKGRVDQVYMKLLNPAKKQRMLYLLSRDYSRYSVSEPFTEWEIKRQTDRIATPVVIVTVILSFMCIYIIHTTFKIIVLERLPVIGTFRSIGAEKRTTDFILLAESLVYGAIGGISGCISGVFLLFAIAALPDTGLHSDAKILLDIKPVQLTSTIGIALLLSVAGSILSIIRTARISIKDIILGTVEATGKSTGRKALFCFIPLGLSLAAPMLIPSKAALAADTACLIITLFSASFLIPIFMKWLLRFLKYCCEHLSGNLPYLAVKMLQNNRNAVSGVSMLMIGISSLYMISTLNWSQIRETEVIFDRSMYEMTMKMPFADKTTLQLLSETDGVSQVLGSYSAGRTEIEGFDEPIWHIQGVNTTLFPTFQKLKTDGLEKVKLSSLDQGRNILLSKALESRLDVKAGDSLVLRIPSGNGGFFSRTYKITGFFETMLQGMWSYALISERSFRMDFREHFYGLIYVKTDKDPLGVMNTLKAAFSKRNPVLELQEDTRKTTRQSSSQLFFMLQGFTVLTMFTGTFGILNNLIIGFLQRKHQLAILRSCGMSKGQMRRMILAEVLVQGIAGSVLGIVVGLGTTWIIVPQIIQALNIESSIYFSQGITVLCFVSGVLAYALAAAGILFKVSDLKIVQEIKQE